MVRRGTIKYGAKHKFRRRDYEGLLNLFLNIQVKTPVAVIFYLILFTLSIYHKFTSPQMTQAIVLIPYSSVLGIIHFRC